MKSLVLIVTKKKIYIWIFTSLIILSLAISMAALKVFRGDNILVDKVIVIDPGHGGVDSGAGNRYILEKDVNLDVALKLRTRLERSGAIVIMTREEDIELGKNGKFDRSRYLRDLNARVDIINNSSACMFVSIHTDSSPNNPKARGMIALYSNTHPHNMEMAKIFQNKFNAYGFREKNNTFKSSHLPKEGKYYVPSHAKIPGVIVETGFITNSTDLYLLKKNEYREYIAEVITMGIIDYLKYRDKLPTLNDKVIKR